MSKTSKELTHKNLNQKEYFNLIKNILLVAVLVVMFCTPYLRGLYFESEQLITEIVILSIFVLFWVYKWLIQDKTFLKTPIEFASLMLVAVYLLSSFTAVSQRLAVAEFLKYAMYFAVFFMISDLTKDEKEKKYVLWTIILSALGVCILGIDSIAGEKIVNIFNLIFDTLNIDFSFFGLFVNGRVHSTMQYPNALASYLMAVFFISISIIITSDKWLKGLASAISFVLLTTFVLTISRGAYLILIFAIPLFVFLLPKEKRAIAAYSIATNIAVVLSFFLLRGVSNADANKTLIWPLVLIGALLSFLVRFTDDRAMKVISKINKKLIIIGSAVLLLAISAALILFFKASVPLELSHTMDAKDEFIGKIKTVRLESNRKYKLVFNVEAKSENEKADFAYRVYIKTRNKTGITTGNEVLIVDEKYSATNNIEEKEIEFEVPEGIEMVDIGFQNYYSGTSVVFYEADIYDLDRGHRVEKIVLKRKYPLAESLISRFENMTADQSFNSRIIFIKDGLKIFKDWWLIGAGGKAWSILNFKYQSYLYWSTETHNYPLQVLVETGLLGILVLILLIASLFISFVKLSKDRDGNTNDHIYNIAVLISVMLLFLHSVMDFDLSLSALYLIVWQLIALLNSNIRGKMLNIASNSNRKRKDNYKLSLKKMDDFFSKGLNVHPIFLILLSLLVLVLPIRFTRARAYTNEALEKYKQNDLNSAIKLMESAAETDYLNMEYVIGYKPIPSNPNIKLGFIDLLIEIISNKDNQSMDSEDQLALNNYIIKAREFAKKAEKHAKYNSEILLNLGAYYLKTADKEKGIDYINKSVKLRPLSPIQWQYKANVLYAMADNYLQQGDVQKGLKYIDDLLGIIDEAKKINENNMSPFIFNDETQKYLEKAYFIKKQITENVDAKVNVNDIVFQSVPYMDVNADNFLDQWTIDNKLLVDSYLENDVFTVSNKDDGQEPYMYTRKLEYEGGSIYRIEVELENYEGIEFIPYKLFVNATEKRQLILDGKVFASEFSLPGSDGTMRLIIYIKDKYNIKNIRLIKIS